jgi:23S rRNA (cytidine2498-2'-O)-methyltransferase
MKYNYILLADSRFISYAISELRERLSIKDRVKTMALGRGIYLAEIAVEPKVAFEALKLSTFSDGVIPIVDIVERPQSVDELKERVSRCAAKGEPFRIELISLGAKRGVSAKDTEVKIGKEMESLGFTVSLKSPQRIVYIIIGEGISVIASAKSTELADLVVDHFRLENPNHDTVNRAEVKIKEAFAAFKINDAKIENCIDVGASPGGWTNFMVKRGAKVVAIDRGVLEYDKLSTKDVKVIEKVEDYVEGSAVLHMRLNLDEATVFPFKKESYDLLAIDTNTDYIESSKIANALAAYVKHGGFLIMTLKLPKISDAGRLYMVNEALKSEYGVERIKKLHHNRMELTLFARRL